jgi:hypothetical protein
MTEKKRTVTIELTEAEYWFAVATAAFQTQTIEEFAKECMDFRIETINTEMPWMETRLEEITSLCS